MTGDPVLGSIVSLNDSWTSSSITTTAHTTLPGTTFHYHWGGCGCGTSVVYNVGCSTHEHDYQQAQGEYRHTLYCRTCGDTKTLKPPKAKKETE